VTDEWCAVQELTEVGSKTNRFQLPVLADITAVEVQTRSDRHRQAASGHDRSALALIWLPLSGRFKLTIGWSGEKPKSKFP
jgi:hypothetical protein